MYESGSTEEFRVGLLAVLKQIEQGVKSATDLSTQTEAIILLGNVLKLGQARDSLAQMAPTAAALSRIDLDIIRIALPLPAAITIDDYFDNVVDTLRAIEFIYSLYALVNSGKSRAITDFVKFSKEHADSTTISNPLLHRFLAAAKVEPLRLVSVYYGSPASFDFLGVGRVLEILRDTIKDLLWRGRHEKQTADLERRSKEMEIERMKLEAEKIIVEIAARKLEIIEKTTKLKLPAQDKQVIISALLPKMVTVAQSSVTPALISKDVMPLISGDVTPSLDKKRAKRRQPSKHWGKIRVGHHELILSERRREVRVDGVLISLTPLEAKVLAYLSDHIGQACSVREIVENVWQDEASTGVEDHDIAVPRLVERLRQKIEPSSSSPIFILTVKGVGYELVKCT